ncbi:unnamed protein product [Hyaloperonospora brassicae]|uniref:Cytochrome b5 heme-binding domain-containing protein n=1 Tax=Hyaloperonospora brassicae TaxID=162125 RepID=A0AAV0T7A8_HYABA|nr:unnamed protein product [Hyaloperonospora brassicae]
MTSRSSRVAAASTSNRVASCIVTAAVFSVLYHLFLQPPAVSCPSGTASSSLDSEYPRHGEESLRSEITGCLLFLGLFGLFQHKKKLDKKTISQAERTLSASGLSRQSTGLATSGFTTVTTFVDNLPRDVRHELLLFLSPRELAMCPLVCTTWDLITGDAAEVLWRRVFQRDFGEPGDRFAKVFPIECWRQFYFRHHLSRAVELARLLDITEGRKCVAIEGQVYDVTDFLELHPGGPHVIGDTVGTDATEIWNQFRHSNEAKDAMRQFLVWDKVLARQAKEKLCGNLESVVTRWQSISWALAYSHCFGRMAPRFTDAVLCYNFRGEARKKEKLSNHWHD